MKFLYSLRNLSVDSLPKTCDEIKQMFSLTNPSYIAIMQEYELHKQVLLASPGLTLLSYEKNCFYRKGIYDLKKIV